MDANKVWKYEQGKKARMGSKLPHYTVKLSQWERLMHMKDVNSTEHVLTRYNEKTGLEYEVEVVVYGYYEPYEAGDWYTPASGGGYEIYCAAQQRNGLWTEAHLTDEEIATLESELADRYGKAQDDYDDAPDYDYEPSNYWD